MTRPLQFIPFKSRSDKGWAEAWELYEKSFPYNERWNAEGYDLSLIHISEPTRPY